MVRNLWGLRLQTLQSRANHDSEGESEHGSQLYSSQSEGDATDTTTKSRARKSKTESMPQLVDALSLCYIGCLLLRLPTSVGDFHAWAASGELIFYRAVAALAQPMRQRLPFNYSQALDPQKVLRPSSLQKAILANIGAFRTSFGMLTPPVNHVLLLYRWVRDLALPLEIYAAVLRIASMLDVDFSYEADPQRRGSKLVVLRLAEVKLMALVVIATKLLFPMDGVKRYPRRPTELSALAMDWAAWTAARKTFDDSVKDAEKLGYEDALRVSEHEVLEMSNDKLDDYMDWYGSTFTTEEVREAGRAGKDAEFRRAMFRLFPVGRPEKQNDEDESGEQDLDVTSRLRENRLKAVQAALKPLRVKQDDDYMREGETMYRPGSKYKRYRDVSEISGYAEDFYKEAARVCALSVEGLVQGVFSMEKRLEDWEETARKQEG